MVRNSLNNNEGTFVISEKDTGIESEKKTGLQSDSGMEEFSIAGVTSDRDKLFVLVRLSRPSVLRALWDKASELHLSMIAPVFSEGEVRFFSDREGAQEWKKGLEALTSDGFVKDFWIDPSIVPVSIVGDRFSQDGRAFAAIMEILVKAEIPVHFGTASSLAMTVGVPLTHVDEAVKLLHSEFFPG